MKDNVSQVDASVFAEGIAGKDGLGTFTQNGDSMIGQCSAGGVGAIKLVSLRTAIERIGGWVDLLKLDCEGAEWDIFSDIEALRNVGTVRMEYHLTHPSLGLGWIIEQLALAGFTAVKIERNQGIGIAWFDRLSAPSQL